MLGNKSTYVTALAYELGDLVSIQDLSELKSNSKVLETLLMLGLEKYSKSELSPPEMAMKSAERTLEKAEISRKEIDAIVYATNSFWNPDFCGYQESSRIIDKLELSNAYPIGVFFSECGNIHTALRTAVSLVQSDECRNVLVVTTDQLENGSSRIVPPDTSIESDGAASCIVSSDVKGEFEILQTVQHAKAKIGNINPTKQMEEYYKCVAEGLKETVEKLMLCTGKMPKDFYKLITNNYNISVMRNICAISGFQEHQIFTNNLSRFAHALAADNLINLCDLLNQNSIQLDDLILLLGTGPNMWGATALRKV